MNFKNCLYSGFIAIQALVYAQNAFAVQTANCPASVSVKYSRLQVISSVEQVLTELDAASMEDEQIKAVEDAVANLLKTEEVARVFPLVKAANGRCVYNAGKTEKVELYSLRGVDKLLMQTDIGPRGILLRLYALVATVSKAAIELKQADASIALAIPRYPYTDYSAGGDLVFVGKVPAGQVAAE